MRKKIEFPPYEEAEVRAICADGTVLCDLYGGKMEPAGNLSERIGESGASIPEQWQWHDIDIVFPAGSKILSLTEQEKIEFEKEQIKEMML